MRRSVGQRGRLFLRREDLEACELAGWLEDHSQCERPVCERDGGVGGYAVGWPLAGDLDIGCRAEVLRPALPSPVQFSGGDQGLERR
jgi:hypothetical protein